MDPMELNLNRKAEEETKKKNSKKSKLTDAQKAAKKAERKKNKKNSNKEKKENKKNKGEKVEKEDKELTRQKRNNDHKNHKNNNKKSSKGKKGKGSNKKQNKSKKQSREDVSKGKTMGALSGIATLRRNGDVEVMNADGHVVVKSQFSVGPLQLEVSKQSGRGSSKSVQTAKAITEKLAGKMLLKVKTDGSAHVKSVYFQKPEEVSVKGSLGDKKSRSDRYLENSMKGIRPLAAQRVLKMARYVLKSPSTVERS